MQRKIDILAATGICSLVVYTTLRNIFAARAKPFWFDELCTVAVARQRNFAAVWNALLRAKDSSPPLYIAVEHICAQLIRNEEIAYRLPSIAGFACVLLCLYIFVRKQQGSACAFLCTLIPAFTLLYKRYATEARAYSLVVACIAVALVCYQHVPKRFWVVLLGVSLAAAEAFHYYAFFSFFAFAVAEIVWSIRAQKIRKGVWIAIAAGFLPLVLSLRLLANLKKFYGPDFWGKPSFGVVQHAYDGLFSASVLRVIPGLGFIFAAGLCAAAIWSALPSVWRRERDSSGLFDPLLGAGLICVPVVAYLATRVGNGSLSGRYLLSMILGVTIAAGCVLGLMQNSRWVLLAAAVLLLFAFGAQEMHFWQLERQYIGHLPRPADNLADMLKSAGHPELPVVVSDGQSYVQLAYHAPEQLRERLLGLVDPPKAVAYAGSDSVDRQIQALTCCLPLHVVGFDSFAATHREFLLYSDSSSFDWWPARLRHDGYSLDSVVSDGGRTVYWARRDRNLNARLNSAAMEAP